MADDVAAAHDRLALMVVENLSVAAAFNLSYEELDEAQQRLFRRVGLHPGTDIDAWAAAALDGSDIADAQRRLAALYDHYLLTEPARGRYRLHDLIGEYARTLAARDDPASDQVQAIARLLDYYQHAAETADRHLTRTPAPVLPRPLLPPLMRLPRPPGWVPAPRGQPPQQCRSHARACPTVRKHWRGHGLNVPTCSPVLTMPPAPATTHGSLLSPLPWPLCSDTTAPGPMPSPATPQPFGPHSSSVIA